MRYYFMYTPTRRGLTGAEYLDSYIDEYYPNVKWNAVISDNNMHFGFLESENSDDLSKAIIDIYGKFSSHKLTQEEFIGAVYLLYEPVAIAPEETPPTFEEFIAKYNIVINSTELLQYAKLFKRRILKELVKRRFDDYNDLIADVTKILTLLFVHYPNLTAEEKTNVDTILNNTTSVYSKEVCINTLQQMITSLNNYLLPYYTAISSLQLASSKEEINSIVLNL